MPCLVIVRKKRQTHLSLCTHTMRQCSKALMIKANDTDVVVIAISFMKSLNELGIEKLWTAFGHVGIHEFT